MITISESRCGKQGNFPIYQETFDKIRTLNGGLIEIHEHIFLWYIPEYFDMKLSISPEKAEQIMWDCMAQVKKAPYSEVFSTMTGVFRLLCIRKMIVFLLTFPV